MRSFGAQRIPLLRTESLEFWAGVYKHLTPDGVKAKALASPMDVLVSILPTDSVNEISRVTT
jgi:hypothetical protein